MSTSTGSFNVALRFVAGVYTGGASFSVTSGARKTLFPRQDVKVLDSSGRFTDAWYRLFQSIYEDKLGGDNGPTVADITSNVVDVQGALTNATAAIPLLSQVVETNANTAAATREALQAANVPGATQIPAPVQSVN